MAGEHKFSPGEQVLILLLYAIIAIVAGAALSRRRKLR